MGLLETKVIPKLKENHVCSTSLEPKAWLSLCVKRATCWLLHSWIDLTVLDRSKLTNMHINLSICMHLPSRKTATRGMSIMWTMPIQAATLRSQCSLGRTVIRANIPVPTNHTYPLDPSGILTYSSYWKWPCLVSFPVFPWKKCDVPWCSIISHVTLPEGKSHRKSAWLQPWHRSDFKRLHHAMQQLCRRQLRLCTHVAFAGFRGRIVQARIENHGFPPGDDLNLYINGGYLLFGNFF